MILHSISVLFLEAHFCLTNTQNIAIKAAFKNLSKFTHQKQKHLTLPDKPTAEKEKKVVSSRNRLIGRVI